MSDSIIIRAYEERDIPAVTSIYSQRSVALRTLQILYTTEEERRTRWVQSATSRFLVAEIAGQIAGHAGLSILTGRRSHVGSIGMGVDERYQGRGVGTALLAALLDLSDNWYNLRRIELSVYCDNAAAVHLYQKFGFTIEGTHPAYAYRDGDYVDAYSMARLRNEPPLTS